MDVAKLLGRPLHVLLTIPVLHRGEVKTGGHPDPSAHLQRATELLREFFLLNFSSLLYAKIGFLSVKHLQKYTNTQIRRAAARLARSGRRYICYLLLYMPSRPRGDL